MRNSVQTVLLGLLTIALLAPTFVGASSHGLDGQTESGCNCHSGGPDTAGVSLFGIPETYTPGENYELTVSLSGGPPPASSGHIGGFNLKATIGELSAPAGSSTVLITKEGESRHQMGDENGLPDTWQTTGEAVHTHSGANQRSWQVIWKAPAPGQGSAKFTVAGNVVDGDHDTPGDSWALNSYSSEEGERSFWQLIEQNFGIIVIFASGIGFYFLWRWMKD